MPVERQVTTANQGHMLTNIGVWSSDSRWIVYDTRSSLDGSVFDGARIERVDAESGRVELLYESKNGANCGVVTYHPSRDLVVFIHGPEHPTDDWRYGPTHRQGVWVDCGDPLVAINLDARNLAPNFTPGALRGGTHVHTFSGNGVLVASTYEDAVLEQAEIAQFAAERNLRGIAISLVGQSVAVPKLHPRNHSGESFTVLATRLTDAPIPGSDEIMRACEEGWIGRNGYLRADGSRQRYAIAFQGTVVDRCGKRINEVFVLDLPEDSEELKQAGSGPLQGSSTTRPAPPFSVAQRRITFTTNRKYPGLSSPRHWLRTTSDGQWIAFLAKDDAGIPQIHCINPNGGPMHQVTHGSHSVSSAFSFSPVGNSIAYVADASIFIADLETGQSRRLTPANHSNPPRAEACVFSPNGNRIAYLRTLHNNSELRNQIFVVEGL